MSKKNSFNHLDNKSLENIFNYNEDRNGTDLLTMSNFFDFFIDDLSDAINSFYQWEQVVNFDALFGRLTTAIKTGFDINDMGIMIADYSHFNKDIINGLKKGIYHIGESKEVEGNMRPAILDKDEHIVKWFTMKKAVNPKEILSNVSSLSMQNSLRQISAELNDINQELKYEIEFTRRQALSLPFINARTKILNAVNNPKNEIKYLEQAESYLIEGLNSLYADIDAEVKQLSSSDFKPTPLKIKELFQGNLKCIDNILGRINEDMLMIPKYVAVEFYLLQHMERYDDVKDVLGQYKYHLEKITNTILPNSEHTAAEIIHELYPYQKNNRDFWLEMPQETISALNSLQTLIESKNHEVFLIETDSEDDTESITETEVDETEGVDE